MDPSASTLASQVRPPWQTYWRLAASGGRRQFRKLLGVGVIGGVALAVATHPLVDPDLGWNLAGGLWIIEHGAVPQVDPLAAYGSEWIDYCYLPQVLFGIVYHLGQFPGLILLQIIASVVTFLAFASLLLKREPGGRAEQISFVVALALGLLFLTPLFHLRPQLFSLFFFLRFLAWRDNESKTLFGLAVIALCWANTHVYWILLPLFLGMDLFLGASATRRFTTKAVAIALLAACCSPYGVRNYLPVFQYAFFHSHAKELIQEFQSLYKVGGYIFPLTVLVLLGVLVGISKRRFSLSESTFCLLLAVLGFWQVKFVPLFGVFSLVLLSRALPRSSEQQSIAPLAGIFAGFAYLVSLFASPTLGEKQQALLRVGEALKDYEGTIFNQFDYGGWLELGLYLSASPEAKPLVDGRTLVMGEERLNAYRDVVASRRTFEGYLREHRAERILLDRDTKLYLAVFQEDKPPQESRYLVKIFEEGPFVLLRN